jgi:hypothetical protein
LTKPRPQIGELLLSDDPERWTALGFRVEDGRCRVGTVTIRFVSDDRPGLIEWTLGGVDAADIDGLPTGPAGDPPETPAPVHSNGALLLDHVVVNTPDLERTTRVLDAAGIERRRVREIGEGGDVVRMGFFRLGEVILEVVESAESRAEPNAPARFWGVVVIVDDLDEFARGAGDALGEVRDAVQPGRRIATVQRAAGLSLPVAFMTPEPPRGS